MNINRKTFALPALVLMFLVLPHKGHGADTPPDSKPLITDAQFKWILDDLAAHGTPNKLGANVSTALELAPKGEQLTLKTDGLMDDARTLHVIAKLNNDSGYLLTVMKSDTAYDYHVGLNRVLVAAVSVSEKEGTVVLPKSEAQKLLDAEWMFWALIADQLLQEEAKNLHR